MWCFPIQQWPCRYNIVTNKGLNLFDDCAAKCVYLCLQEEECTYSKIYTPGTIANSKTDRTPTKKNHKWCCFQSNNFSRTRDTIRHLKSFRVISSEVLVLLLILCWYYFGCLKMYSENFLMTQLSIFWKK